MSEAAQRLAMETALRESLISHTELRQSGLTITAQPDGSVSTAFGSKALGTWRWEGGSYAFRRPGRAPVEIEVATPYGAIVYLATLIDVELLSAFEEIKRLDMA